MEKKYRVSWRGLQFYYMTHIDNLKDILKYGILSHNQVIEKGLHPKNISDEEIVNNRKDILVGDKSLWDYSNVYFRVNNAMHYRVIKNIGAENIAIICINKAILKREGSKISDGNAASFETNFYNPGELKNILSKIGNKLKLEWWKNVNDKRQMMAEALILNSIPPGYINTIIVSNQNVREKLLNEIGTDLSLKGISIISYPKYFNQPIIDISIPKNIRLIEGDMFFSDNQTLTVSVNTVGVMGKGLASRVKHQFRDVEEYYKQALSEDKLKMGVPVLYKRDKNISQVMSDMDYTEEDPTWFLIFPTKNHWRNPSDKEGIEKGLIYLKENYQKWEIKSLALPALGCGLGWLDWREIGPLMIKHLKDIEIPIEIYLPRESRIPKEQITKEFLLGEN